MAGDAGTSAVLAYITDDSSLAVAGIGGGSPERRVLLDMRRERMVFMWPSWSPDGESIAVSASSSRTDDQRLELWRTPLDGSGTETIYENPAEGRQVIAPGLAHYASWSPLGRALAVTGNTGAGIALSLVSAAKRAEGGRPRRLIDGAPLYFAWSPDGRALMIHRGAQLLLFDLAGGGDRPRTVLRAKPTFRAPIWSSDGERYIYGAPKAGSKSALYRGERQSAAEAEELFESPGAAAFTKAPNSDLVAVVGIQEDEAGAGQDGGGVRVFDIGGSEPRQISKHPASAAAWTPDGEALLAFEPQPNSTMITVTRYNLDEGRPRPIARFQPSAEYATLLAFFDQFALSHQIVSPDGRWLTLSGLALGNGGSGRRGLGPQNGCYVVALDGSSAPRRIGAGSIGFFSPAGGAP